MHTNKKILLICSLVYVLSLTAWHDASAQIAKVDSIENLSLQSAESVSELAVLEQKKGRFKNAAELFSKAFGLDRSLADNAYNAACAYSLAGDADLAFSWLDQALNAGFIDVAQATKDSDLKSLHPDARWGKFLERLNGEIAREHNFWDSKAIGTSYRDQLSEEERIAGLSKFWSEIKYNFVFTKKLMDLDWDALYLQYLPKVKAAKNTGEYYKLLMEMCALLRDGHTNVYPPDEVYESSFAMPLIRTALIEGRVIVTEVADLALSEQGLSRGDEIIKVNGRSVKQYAESEISPYVSASTPQDLEARTYTYQFLSGPIEESLQLECMDASGKIFTVKAQRTDFDNRNKNFKKPSSSPWRLLPGNIAYVALNSFSTVDAVKIYLKDFPEISKAKAIIFDIRKNGGGSTGIGFEVLRTLTERPFEGSNATSRDYLPINRARGGKEKIYQFPKMSIPPNESLHYTGKVVVLTSALTFSAAEDFAVAFKTIKRGLIIGEPTAGSTGQPLGFKLPGGGSARVCTKKDSFPDGSEFVGIGVQPDIAVHPTVSDFRANVDTVLEKALADLR